MGAVLVAFLTAAGDIVRRRSDLEPLALRHQMLVLQRQRGGRRLSLRFADRWLPGHRIPPPSLADAEQLPRRRGHSSARGVGSMSLRAALTSVDREV